MSDRELRIAVAPSATGFDVEQGGANGIFHRLCYARLLVYPPALGPDGEMVGNVPVTVGSLAETVSASEDFLTYRVTLKKDVHSPYGNRFTAHDVVWGWERAFGLRDVGKWVAMVGSIVDANDVVAIDDETVEFRLRQPNPTFVQQLTRSTPSIYDAAEARKHATGEDPWAKAWLQRNPAGFGAYMVESVTPWKEAVFVANPGAPNPPAITKIRIIIVPGAQRRLDMLRNGEVDLLPTITPEDAQQLKGAGGVRVSQVRSGRHVALMMNCQQAPFTDARVRQAVSYAIPYQRILDEVYFGTARAWQSPIPEVIPMADASAWGYDYNPAKARELLAEAGFPNGFDTEMFVDSADDEHVAASKIVGPALAAVGINATIERLDPAIFWQGARYFRPYSMLIYEDNHQVPDPYYALVHDYQSGKMGLINCGLYGNSEVDALIKAVEKEPDTAKRQALVAQAQRLINQDAPNAMLAQPGYIAAMRTNLEGFYWPPDSALVAETLRFKD